MGIDLPKIAKLITKEATEKKKLAEAKKADRESKKALKAKVRPGTLKNPQVRNRRLLTTTRRASQQLAAR
jgi:hypothetical protein